ncbi:2-hydroxy-3-oxopropionate reductase [mine drainage metagenome]|uniref:2-hydroxy-3-oxopropionate reductase n=1 Tax=mine drainage metagenome TaxID=410659 RepID=A0A1J5SHK8_9ZZZZ
MTAANPDKLRLGWIGLGRMGEVMVKRLLQHDCDLSIWNRTRSKAEPLRDYGARLVDSKADLASCDIVFTMVTTTDDLKEVLFGKDGLLSAPAKPRMIVDSTSISQDGSAEVRAELAKRGIDYLCAPVSGNAKVVKAGKLLVVASGPKAAYETAKPYLAMFGRSEIWVGEGELARVWKIAHNTMFGVIFQTLCEVTVLAEKAGIPRHVFLESINNSVLGSMYTRYKTPTMVNLDFDKVTFTPKLLLKDMDLGMSAGKAHGVPMPAAAITRESIAGLVGRGYGEIDFAVLLAETAKSAGLELQSENIEVADGLA